VGAAAPRLGRNGVPAGGTQSCRSLPQGTQGRHSKFKVAVSLSAGGMGPLVGCSPSVGLGAAPQSALRGRARQRHQSSMEEWKGRDFGNLRRFVQSVWVSTLATPPLLVMIAQHSVRNLCASAYAALQLSASRKATVSLCGSKSSCSSVRVGFGALQCAALETAPVRSFVRCVRL
jgi:hypothetical protein